MPVHLGWVTGGLPGTGVTELRQAPALRSGGSSSSSMRLRACCSGGRGEPHHEGDSRLPKTQAGRREAELANPRGTEALVHGCETQTGGQAGVRPGRGKENRGTPPSAHLPELPSLKTEGGSFTLEITSESSNLKKKKKKDEMRQNLCLKRKERKTTYPADPCLPPPPP